jgi:uncharacterized membrane protein required for colicin V production
VPRWHAKWGVESEVLTDVVIVLVLIACVVIGVFRGALRQLILLGAWLLALVLAAQIRQPFADWLLGQEPDFSRQYAGMVVFIVGFLVLLTIALVVIELGGRTIVLSHQPAVDEVLGGALMLGVGLLAVAGLLIALGTYYGAEPRGVTAEIPLLSNLNNAVEGSAIVHALRDSLIPGLLALLGPLLPADVRGVV